MNELIWVVVAGLMVWNFKTALNINALAKKVRNG